MDKTLTRQRLTYFTIFWALLGLFQSVKYGGFLTPAFQIFQLSIILALCRPSSLPAFVFLIAAGFTRLFFGILTNTNDVVLATFVDFAILAVLAFYFLTRRLNGRPQGDIYSMFAPILRIYVIGFYFFAFFSKLNLDFLDPQVSCAARYMAHLQRTLPAIFGFSGAETAAIWGTIFVEGLLPVLFLSRRTRHWGIVLGIILHTAIGLVPELLALHFQLLMVILYFVFLSDGAFANIARWGGQFKSSFQNFVPSAAVRYLLIAAAAYGAPFLSYVLHKNHTFWTICWIAVYVPVVVVFLGAIRQDRRKGAVEGYFIPRPAFLLVLVIPFMINGLTPYLGIKTRGTFEMFSNLSTLGPRYNHLIFPSWMAIYKPDLIKILDSDEPRLKVYASSGFLLPSLEFRRIANDSKLTKFFVRCVYQGQVITLNKSGPDNSHPLLKPVPWIISRVLGYVPVDAKEQCRCR